MTVIVSGLCFRSKDKFRSSIYARLFPVSLKADCLALDLLIGLLLIFRSVCSTVEVGLLLGIQIYFIIDGRREQATKNPQANVQLGQPNSSLLFSSSIAGALLRFCCLSPVSPGPLALL